jgi:hypothetical protein
MTNTIRVQMTLHRFMSLLAMGFLWTGSQIPLYLFGAIPPIIYADIGGVDRYTWFVGQRPQVYPLSKVLC